MLIGRGVAKSCIYVDRLQSEAASEASSSTPITHSATSVEWRQKQHRHRQNTTGCEQTGPISDTFPIVG